MSQSQYLKFTTEGGGEMLIEVEREEAGIPEGPVKVGLGDKIRDSVVAARASLDAALTDLISSNAALFLRAVDAMERPPAEAELSFSIKATGELGNFAIAKVGGEANYSVRVLWQAE
jgi:hypothetical protein